MNPHLIKRIEWTTIGLGLVLALFFALTRGSQVAMSSVIGCALGLLNFELLRVLVQRMIRGALAQSTSSVGRSSVLFGIKLVALAGVLFLLMRIERLDVMGLAAGFLSFLVAIVVASLMPAPAGELTPQTAPGSKVE